MYWMISIKHTQKVQTLWRFVFFFILLHNFRSDSRIMIDKAVPYGTWELDCWNCVRWICLKSLNYVCTLRNHKTMLKFHAINVDFFGEPCTEIRQLYSSSSHLKCLSSHFGPINSFQIANLANKLKTHQKTDLYAKFNRTHTQTKLLDYVFTAQKNFTLHSRKCINECV